MQIHEYMKNRKINIYIYSSFHAIMYAPTIVANVKPTVNLAPFVLFAVHLPSDDKSYLVLSMHSLHLEASVHVLQLA